MSLPEQFRPKLRTELVGNKKAIDKVEDCILSYKTCLITGQAGIGKTTAVFVIANEIGYKVREWNASDSRKKGDFENILRELKSKTFTPTIFLLDEIDGLSDEKEKGVRFNPFTALEECIKSTTAPLVLICNDLYKIPKTVTQLCELIRFYPPYTNEVSEVIKRISLATGKKADYSRINSDVRNSIINAFYNSEKYQTLTVYDEIEALFKKGETKQLNPDYYIWLIDNAPSQTTGRKLFTFYQLLNVCDKLNNFTPLKSLAFGYKAKIEYPRFIKRVQILKKGKPSADKN